jgi:hypothetical protein
MDRLRTTRLQELIHGRDKVLAVLHPPTAAHARILFYCAMLGGAAPRYPEIGRAVCKLRETRREKT